MIKTKRDTSDKDRTSSFISDNKERLMDFAQRLEDIEKRSYSASTANNHSSTEQKNR